MRKSAFYTIPPGCSFARDLAAGLLASSPTPDMLARTLIFVPTRRAARALSEAFLAVSDGTALLLPQIRAIGDIDDESDSVSLLALDPTLPPALPETRRLCIIARQIHAFPIGGQRPTEAQSFTLARALISLFDQIQNAEFDVQDLASLWPDDLSAHWQDIAQFLSILTNYWPAILAQEEAMDPVARRLALLHKQIAQWESAPPEGPVIVAGSTGTLAGTRRLMAAVARLPQGQVVFPGLITDMTATDWEAIGADKTHPFHPLHLTLEALSLSLEDVQIWPASQAQAASSAPRLRFLSEVMRPASQTDLWRQLATQQDGLTKKESFAGFRRLEATDSHEEAAIIALLLRQQLETPRKTAILVTPDRQLAQMVRSELQRFDITIDDSAGERLITSAIGAFLFKISRLIGSKDPLIDMVQLCDHPFAAGGMDRSEFRAQFQHIQKHHLRGALSFHDLDGLISYLQKQEPDAAQFVEEHIKAPLAPLLALSGRSVIPLSLFAQTLGEVAEAMAATRPSGTEDAVLKLWSGAAGEAAANLLAELTAYGTDYAMPASALTDVMQSFLQSSELRKPYHQQSRLAILGAVESRMLTADMVILSGLNEGIWPPKPEASLWMNSAMAAEIGLPHRQWRIALSAHDFMMAAAQPEVVITRARRQNDRPTLPSRWLTRMDAVMEGAGISDLIASRLPEDIAAILAYRKSVEVAAIGPPAPRPPVPYRPDSLSATQLDRLIADPYGIYADKILRLRALRPVNEPPNAALKGNLFHEALQLFIEAYPEGALTPSHAQILCELARPLFQPYWHHLEVAHIWWPQMEKLATWFVAHDNHYRGADSQQFVETKAICHIAPKDRQIALTAKADRIIKTGDEAHIIDYKTGVLPTKKSVALGRSIQMLVEAALLSQGGFTAIGPATPHSLSYWKLKGRGTPAAEISNVTPEGLDSEALFQAMVDVISHFEEEDAAYYSEPDPALAPKYSDYRHLARIKEWRISEAGND